MKSLKDEEIIDQNMVGSTHQGEPVDDDDGCCPGCYDDRQEEYYKRLMSVKMPEGMSLNIRRGTEGPQHDPYGWTVYDVRMPDGTRVMYRDAILSECLNIIRPDETLRFSAPEYDGDISMELMFKDIVGYGFDQLDHWDNAVAELAAGWDSSP